MIFSPFFPFSFWPGWPFTFCEVSWTLRGQLTKQVFWSFDFLANDALQGLKNQCWRSFSILLIGWWQSAVWSPKEHELHWWTAPLQLQFCTCGTLTEYEKGGECHRGLKQHRQEGRFTLHNIMFHIEIKLEGAYKDQHQPQLDGSTRDLHLYWNTSFGPAAVFILACCCHDIGFSVTISVGWWINHTHTVTKQCSL